MVFLCLYDQKSARRTAEILSISQPTVSYSLKRLRSCFGDVLFDLGQGSLKPTPKADAIEPYLRNVLDAINRCSQMELDSAVAPARRVVRICAPEYFELLLLPSVLEIFMTSGRQASLFVERLGRDLPVERLLAGEVDIAIGFGPGYYRMHPGLLWESLLSDKFVCLSANRRAKAHQRISLDEFCDMQHVFPTPWVSDTNMIDGWLERIGRTRNVVARASTYQACLNIVARLPVLLALPQRLVPFLSIPPHVQVSEPPLGFPNFTLDIVWAAQSDDDAELRWIRNLLKSMSTDAALTAALGSGEDCFKPSQPYRESDTAAYKNPKTKF